MRETEKFLYPVSKSRVSLPRLKQNGKGIFSQPTYAENLAIGNKGPLPTPAKAHKYRLGGRRPRRLAGIVLEPFGARAAGLIDPCMFRIIETRSYGLWNVSVSDPAPFKGHLRASGGRGMMELRC
eukprot:7699471-Pyramimonas_sp.AAC.1